VRSPPAWAPLCRHRPSITTRTDPRNDVFLGGVGGGIDLAAVQLATTTRKKRIRVTFRLHSRVLKGSLEQPGAGSPVSDQLTSSKGEPFRWRL
jgi:hypothetical protein